ncbi:GntR family transcriptional regulator [Streptomyces sp. 891-h]|uniref:winged helix-turn-helix domain-containing protein n=1 Tax=unclassified Streptomyces TaxID=2593676 RepID=UPI001FA9B9EC|nr:GntR family transcriptional regulator [Streptomyces sp. 891-h]UNZ18859.1 GntR family transcriptional regulator [Streptomyces sp. 891-h]
MTTPKYREIENTIRARIADGTYPPGTALPSEDALAAEFGVTRPTVRAGLAELRSTDAVAVISGRGAFVRDPELTALRRERDVAWEMAKREADRAEQAEATVRRALDLAAELETEGHAEVAARIRDTLEP